MDLDVGRARRRLGPRPRGAPSSVSRATCSRSLAVGLVDAGGQVGDGGLVLVLGRGERLAWTSFVDALDLGLDDLAQAWRVPPCDGLARAADDLAGGGEDDVLGQRLAAAP